ncbi:D-lactate ferricytochrome c oxidoreductase [Extremus antarcticus]|uniref:D-lactate dehydrogenase (cytochrome) n=1 Tax=Extremus antarcticus TaxID=702011 RepID=A0AAJ0GA30_9PEZI|nr:D-lactate ferricytochrome c oxidoreductase [Extremus antarcticus]
MSRTPVTSQWLRHQLRHASSRRVAVCQAQTSGVRRYATEEKEERESFKGQLYHSTHERVQRERADEERFARHRDAEKASGSSLGMAIPIALLAGALGGWLMGKQTPKEADPSSTAPLATTKPPQHDTAPATLQAAWADFKDVVGEENLSTNAGELQSHAGSEWSSYSHKESDQAFCIVKPASTEDVSAIMKICHKRRVPVTAYSGGTSLEGHYAATRGGVCVDFSRMDKIIKLHKEDLDVVVQPAVGWEVLNEELAEHGLFFPPDPGPGAMIGGMISTGCSGTNAYRYGTMKDWVLSITVVMADGTIVKTRQRPRKSSAGYDLTRTFIGSEGTLGLVCEAVLKVTPKPQNTRVAICTFPSIRSAADCVFRVVGDGVPVAAVEILDDVQMKCINDVGRTSRSWKEAPTLFFKFNGTPNAVKEHISIVKDHAKKAGSQTFEFARNAEEGEELWEARKEALWSVMAQKKDDSDHVWTTDVAVPISRLADIIDETKSEIAKSGLTGAIVGHVGDGNFHAIILYNDKEHDIADDLVHNMVKRAIEMEGTATGEHGVGLVKRDYLPHEVGTAAVDLMRKMKQAFDPLCLLNCDKVVRAQQPKPGEVQEW